MCADGNILYMYIKSYAPVQHWWKYQVWTDDADHEIEQITKSATFQWETLSLGTEQKLLSVHVFTKCSYCSHIWNKHQNKRVKISNPVE